MSYVTQTAMHEKTGGAEMAWSSDSLGFARLFLAKGKVRDRVKRKHVMEGILTMFEG